MIEKTADVLIQAGHEGRTEGATGAVGPLGREIDWNPVVADEASRLLRGAGITVLRETAFLEGPYQVRAAVFVHFDASRPPGSSGASVGYGDPAHQHAAQAWKDLYARHWPFRWMPDNFTPNLSGYYGFRHVRAADVALVVELGDMTGADQAAWLQPRLGWLGALLARYVCLRLGREDIPDPIETL